MKLVSPTGKPQVLHPVHPNIGLAVGYHFRLNKLIDRLHRSVTYWLRAQWNAQAPVLATDASPARAFLARIRRLGSQWTKRFNTAAEELGRWFSVNTMKHADNTLRDILKRAGWTVRFRMTPATNDIMQATIGAQVGLIKSIGQHYLGQVQQSVMRSVQAGRDIGTLAAELEVNYHVSKRSAALIARDQNNKATAAITRARQVELGINKAIWMHSGGGKEPRPLHVAFARGSHPEGGPVYDVRQGAPLADNQSVKWTWPGVEINCRCISRPIIPGLEAFS